MLKSTPVSESPWMQVWEWNHHLHELSSKATKTLILIKRNFWFCDEDTKCLLYKTLVRPKLEYASVVWDPHYLCDLNDLENIQRAAARFCKGDYKYSSSVTSMIKDLEWEPLASRRMKTSLNYACTMYKISNDIIYVNESKYLTPATKTQTRGSHGFKYFVEHTSTHVFKYFYFPRTVRGWNSLPSDIVSAKSLDIFKSMLSDYLRGDYYEVTLLRYLFIFIFIFIFYFISYFLLNFISFFS